MFRDNMLETKSIFDRAIISVQSQSLAFEFSGVARLLV